MDGQLIAAGATTEVQAPAAEAQAITPKVRKPRIKAPPPEAESEPEVDELAPDLSDADNVEMPGQLIGLTEADFTNGLESARSALVMTPPEPKVRKPRKPRAKKAA